MHSLLLFLALTAPQQNLAEEPRVREEIIVTATRTRQRLSESATSAVVIGESELRNTAAPTVDDALRQVPGFTLFRRSGSRTANPTAQGVSLRGVGASGASRAVVLDDGIPLNDPFGGWVYWARVPRIAVEQVEVARGGASELYGSGALTGAIQLIRRTPRVTSIDVDASFGTDETTQAALFSSTHLGGWRVALSGEIFRTEGSIAVRPADRGAVDQPVNSRHTSADLTLSRELTPSSNVFIRGSLYDEARANGTPLQTNDTFTQQVSLGFDYTWGGVALVTRAFALDQIYHQSFSAISPDRSSERLTRLQEVPVDAFGLSSQMVAAAGSHAVVAGMDLRRTTAMSDEDVIGATVTRSAVEATQHVGGLYVEDVYQPASRLTITAALRYDWWQNADARRISGSTFISLTDREDDAISPRLSALYRVDDTWSVFAAAYRAFRAPTLNELYRSFRVGNVLTLANEGLRPEELRGADFGLVFSRGAVNARATMFHMEVENNIANVTLSTEPNLITRQRQNIGATRSRGVELDLQAMVSAILGISAGYLFVEPTVREFPASPELEGRDIAQVSRHQASAQLRVEPARRYWTGAVQVRWVGDQFEDDRNEFVLGSFTVVDALLTRRLTPALEAVVVAENLFDEEYEIGRTPVVTVGAPRSVRAGVRVTR